MRDLAAQYQRDIVAIAKRYEVAMAHEPPRRKEAVDQLVAFAQRLHGEVARIHFQLQGPNASELLGGPMHLYERLYGMLEHRWGADLLSPVDTSQQQGDVTPDDLDLAICRSLVEIFIDLGSVMYGYDLHKRADEALAVIGHNPIGNASLRILKKQYGVDLLDYYIRPRIGTAQIGLDDLVEAMFAQFEPFEDSYYWSEFVDCALEAFGFGTDDDDSPVRIAYSFLDDQILPMAGALEIPEPVAKVIATFPEWEDVHAAVRSLQRRFMRALILEIDPSMSHRTITLEQLQELGLPEPQSFDPDAW